MLESLFTWLTVAVSSPSSLAILAVVFNLSAANLFFSLFLIIAYAVGHCSVIVLAGTSTEMVQHYLSWNEKSRGTVIVKKLSGVLVILGGIYFILGGGK